MKNYLKVPFCMLIRTKKISAIERHTETFEGRPVQSIFLFLSVSSVNTGQILIAFVRLKAEILVVLFM